MPRLFFWYVGLLSLVINTSTALKTGPWTVWSVAIPYNTNLEGSSFLQQCDLKSLCLPLLVLQEVEKIRQQSTHEGVHKDGPEYRAKIKAATKEYMPLSVSTISIDIKPIFSPFSEWMALDYVISRGGWTQSCDILVSLCNDMPQYCINEQHWSA